MPVLDEGKVESGQTEATEAVGNAIGSSDAPTGQGSAWYGCCMVREQYPDAASSFCCQRQASCRSDRRLFSFSWKFADDQIDAKGKGLLHRP